MWVVVIEEVQTRVLGLDFCTSNTNLRFEIMVSRVNSTTVYTIFSLSLDGFFFSYFILPKSTLSLFHTLQLIKDMSPDIKL